MKNKKVEKLTRAQIIGIVARLNFIIGLGIGVAVCGIIN